MTNESPLGDIPPGYNQIFEKLVSDPNWPRIEELVAYSLYKVAKREWARELWESAKRKPTDAELEGYTKTWTAAVLSGKRTEAASVLAAYAESVIEDNAPQIREDALRGTFRSAVGAAVLGAFVYTVLLIVAAVILKLVGVDLIGVFEHVQALTTNPK